MPVHKEQDDFGALAELVYLKPFSLAAGIVSLGGIMMLESM